MPKTKKPTHKTFNQSTASPAVAIDAGAPKELPEWFTETPDETTYTLSMFDGGGGSVQDIDTTREEFLELKTCLARLRGYQVPA